MALDGALEYILAACTVCIVAFATVYGITPYLIRYLVRRNMTVPDMHKKGRPAIPRPGGPAIIAGIITSEIALYAFFPHVEILAILASSTIAFAVGWIDDKKAMGGWFKPLALAFAAVPILALGAYGTDLAFPIFGTVHIPLLYLGIIVIMIPITGNTINSIDVFNGAASGFMVIAGISLTICLLIVQNYTIAIASLPLIFVSLAFYKYHKSPSRIFPGDSGALAFGGMYGALAIVGQVEILAAIAILPAIINSFLFLSSVKRIVEHREIKIKATFLTDDLKLNASRDPKAPISLVRIIVSKIPMTEGQIVREILKLAAFSGILAVITAFLMGVNL